MRIEEEWVFFIESTEGAKSTIAKVISWAQFQWKHDNAEVNKCFWPRSGTFKGRFEGRTTLSCVCQIRGRRCVDIWFAFLRTIDVDSAWSALQKADNVNPENKHKIQEVWTWSGVGHVDKSVGNALFLEELTNFSVSMILEWIQLGGSRHFNLDRSIYTSLNIYRI